MKRKSTSRTFSAEDTAAALAAAPQTAIPDEDNPSTSPEDWDDAIVSDSLADLREQRAKRRGPQKAPTKVAVSIRLSPEVLDYFRSTGKGWQTRVDEVLQNHVASHRRDTT